MNNKQDQTGFIFNDDDLKAVMCIPSGRRFVWSLLDNAQVFQTAFAGEQTHYTAFNEGKKYQGTLLFAQLQEVCPDLYLRMISEMNKESTLENLSLKKHEDE